MLTLFTMLLATIGGIVYLDIHFNDAKIVKSILSKINSLIK